MKAAPGELSVVVASPRDDLALLGACLQSVLPQARALGVPVVVARRGDARAALDRLGVGADEAAAVGTADDASLPRLRGAGLAAVRTPAAALIEDHCIADPGWLAVLSAAAGGADVVGGRMGNAKRDRIVDWAAFFSEYGFFSGMVRDGAVPLVTGANVLYGARALPLAARWAAEGLWEDVIHARLAAAGCTLAIEPRAEMLQNHRYAVAPFCRDRFEHGYDYARVRLRERPRTARWARALTAPLLPLVLVRRLQANVAADDRRAFVRALPLTTLFLGAWALGELAGYVRGAASPGPAAAARP